MDLSDTGINKFSGEPGTGRMFARYYSVVQPKKGALYYLNGHGPIVSSKAMRTTPRYGQGAIVEVNDGWI